jgi:urease beta subunit
MKEEPAGRFIRFEPGEVRSVAIRPHRQAGFAKAL